MKGFNKDTHTVLSTGKRKYLSSRKMYLILDDHKDHKPSTGNGESVVEVVEEMSTEMGLHAITNKVTTIMRMEKACACSKRQDQHHSYCWASTIVLQPFWARNSALMYHN